MSENTASKILLVEGDTDKRIIPELMEANGVQWGSSSDTWPVQIKESGGFTEMVDEGYISTFLKTRGLKMLGIIADANQSAEGRWRSLRNRCLDQFPGIPESLPEEGLIVTNDEGLKLGIWLMPDNQSHGMMETFLTHLVGDNNDPVLKHAESACTEAKSLGAPFKDVQADKAKIHTWLAWQDPPGRQLHQAVMQNILDPRSPHADAFVKWFRSLFDL